MLDVGKHNSENNAERGIKNVGGRTNPHWGDNCKNSWER
jgi:hypothetical protein